MGSRRRSHPRLQSFETEILTENRNLAGVAGLNRALIPKAGKKQLSCQLSWWNESRLWLSELESNLGTCGGAREDPAAAWFFGFGTNAEKGLQQRQLAVYCRRWEGKMEIPASIF